MRTRKEGGRSGRSDNRTTQSGKGTKGRCLQDMVAEIVKYLQIITSLFALYKPLRVRPPPGLAARVMIGIHQPDGHQTKV
jgi:hypothetical protein